MSADYEFEIEDGVLIVTDLDKGQLSVTNGMLNILKQIETKLGASLLKRPIVYCDSDGDYDITDYQGNHIQYRYGGGNLSIAKALAKRHSELKLKVSEVSSL